MEGQSGRRRWLRLVSRWGLLLITTLAVLVAAVTIADAAGVNVRGIGDLSFGHGDRHSDGENGNSWHGHKHRDGKHSKHGNHSKVSEELAAIVGTDRAALREALADGDTLAQIADANGIDADTVVEEIVQHINDHLDDHVADGDLTAAEADAKREGLEEQISSWVNNGWSDELDFYSGGLSKGCRK